ncbi:glycosyltransferase family 39 protein [Sediminibacterium goheungense]|uniref:4-amino-4-deoxy-L-arabinose transferase-like glycosyltransferase n=1 Tax=Sediminibacterium goheungense TaxID=1086393 RepID=A0A4R6ITT5_9BACT|nr:glycosyltransferase family 39 protein [Sediminibacterium goheungense]TDO25717.1 4-amino-4-deoxy-L-arabinose transferase-like glycosyltransferase [Sediminibacterium goheungense]
MNNRLFGFVLSACVVVYIISMWQIPVIDIDAAQYASMSREMMENGSYLKLYDLGFDYLDKPPMLFWLSSLSLSFFGVFDWAYRLPSVLMLLLGIYATYQFTLLFYQRTIAQLAAIILASSQAVFLMVHDVRCDTMLLGWVMFSLWQLAAWYETNQWKHFFLAFAAIAGGMMTKGPIALMIPVFAFVPHFMLRREWKQFFRWQYIPGLLIVAILLIPMSIGLYQQFDLEPGKVFHGRAIQSGLRFYYWTQSFGRYTGENVFNEMNHFTFLLENMLWSFLPWILFFLVGLWLVIRQLIQQKCRIGKEEEWISAGGFIITYCILARSQAQLPHYIFVVLPLAAITTARAVYTLLFEKKYPRLTRVLFWIHTVIFLLLWAAAIVLMVWPFPEIHWLVKLISIFGLLLYGWVLFKPGGSLPKLMRMALLTVIGVNLCLATGFYPHLLQYQFGNTVAKVLDEKKIRKERVILYNIDESRALHFYGKHIFQRKTDSLSLQSGDILITRKESLSALQQRFPKLNTIFEGAYYGVSMLSLPFLNPQTRSKETVPYVLVVLNGQP